MKVENLIKLLQEMNPEAEVLLSHDEEGNEYGPQEGFAVGNFDNEEQSPLGIRPYCYSMEDNECHGDYVILYPR